MWVNAPVEVREACDSKGLYKKARDGQIPNFTGISAPYEPPGKPAIIVHADRQAVNESLAQIIDFLKISLIAQDYVI